MDARVFEIWRCLGGSFVYDEYKGDLRRAERLVQAASRQVGNDRSVAAEVARVRAVVALLRGVPARAEEALADAATLLADDPCWQLRILALRALAHRWRWIVLPDGSGRLIYELAESWDHPRRVQGEKQRWAELWAAVPEPSPERLEAVITFHVVAEMPIARSLLMMSAELQDEARFQRNRDALFQGLGVAEREAKDLGLDPTRHPLLLRYRAELHRCAGELEPAGRLLRAAQRAYQTAGDDAGQGVCRMLAGDWKVAPFTTPATCNHVLFEGTSDNKLDAFWESRELDGGELDVAGARRDYQRAEGFFRRCGAERGLAALDLRRGYVARLRGDADAALDDARRAEKRFDRCGDRLGRRLAVTHRLLAEVASDAASDARAAARALGRWGRREQGCAAFAWGLGLFCSRVGRSWMRLDGDVERSERCARLAQSVYESLGTEVAAGMTLVDQASIFDAVGERSSAVVRYTAAVETFSTHWADERLGRITWEQAVEAQLAKCHLLLREQDPAGLAKATRTLRTWREGEPRGGGPSLFADGFEDVSGASIDLSLGFYRVVPWILRARRAQEAGDFVATADFLEHARLRLAELPMAEQRSFLLAMVDRLAERISDAAGAFERFLELMDGELAFTRQLARRVGEAYGKAGREVLRRHRLRRHRHALSFYVRIGDFAAAEDALAALESALAERWWKDSPRPWESLSFRGQIHEGQGCLEAAQTDYETAMGLLESRRRLLQRDELRVALGNARGVQTLFLAAARSGLKLRRAALADGDERAATRHGAQSFSVAQRGKSRALLALIATAEATLDDEAERLRYRRLQYRCSVMEQLLEAEQRREPVRRARLRALQAKLEAARWARDEVTTRLPAARAGLRLAVASPEAVARRLPEATAVLEYYFVDTELLVWAVTTDGLVAAEVRSVSVPVLNAKMRAFLAACSRADAGTDEAGVWLSKTLLEPVAEVVAAARHLIIAGYGLAHRLPFSALPWEGDVLLATHSISSVSSASLLTLSPRACRDEPRVRRPALVVGNPTGMAVSSDLDEGTVALPPLPYAELEARSVARRFDEVTLLLGEAATREAVLAQLPGARYLHFATHAHVLETVPLLSSLLLAGGESLSALDLMGMQLDVELAVLSACDTGKGHATRGDDLIGFTRGLLAAGCRHAVVTLWPVSDFASCLLMSAFYRFLGEEGSVSPALRRAQLHVRGLEAEEIQRLRQGWLSSPLGEPLRAAERAAGGPAATFRHPRYWAPFALVGAP